MKFSCTQDIFSKALSLVSKGVSNNNTLPVLENILITSEGTVITLLSTDLDISVSTRFEARVEQEGSITIPAKLLLQYVSLLPEGVVIDVEKMDGEALSLSSSVTNTKIKGISAEEFPIIPPLNPDISFALEKDLFISGMAEVLFSTAVNSTRPVLSGVNMNWTDGVLYLVSTDSVRLSEKKIPVALELPEGKSLIIPAKTVAEAMHIFGKESSRAKEIQISATRNQIMFEAGDTKLVSRLIEGEFPNYKQIIPKEENNTCLFGKNDMLLALRRINLFAKGNNYNVKFSMNEDKTLTVRTDMLEIGEDHSTLQMENFSGEPMTFALNSQFVIELLSNLKSEKVQLSINTPAQPAVFRDTEQKDSYLHIIMPLRTS